METDVFKLFRPERLTEIAKVTERNWKNKNNFNRTGRKILLFRIKIVPEKGRFSSVFV
jgi:hypothetical protein